MCCFKSDGKMTSEDIFLISLTRIFNVAFQFRSSRRICREKPCRPTPSSSPGTRQRTPEKVSAVTNSTTTTRTSVRTCESPSLRRGTPTWWRTWRPTPSTISALPPDPAEAKGRPPRLYKSEPSSMVSYRLYCLLPWDQKFIICSNNVQNGKKHPVTNYFQYMY